MKYYSMSAILGKKATYNIIVGERSNGKTYACLLHALKVYFKSGGQFAYVRRWQEDIKASRCQSVFASIVSNGELSKISKGEFTGIHYYGRKFYLCNYNDKGKPVYKDEDVIGFAFAISDGEHDKSTSYPKVETIIFDEFLTNKVYLVDEFVLFMNTVSTIVRRRENVQIFMLGNTVNRYSPYFKEMGLTHIQKQVQGTIDVYKYGTSELTVAVEYCANTASSYQKQSMYFAFENSKLEMITNGAWELSMYPHLPMKYKPKDIYMIYFIEFGDELFQCEIINVKDVWFTYIHLKTTPIQNPTKELIFSLDFHPEMVYSRNILKPINRVQQKVLWFFKADKVFYQNNSIGDSISNYLKICKTL